jgi:hypothetical protein
MADSSGAGGPHAEITSTKLTHTTNALYFLSSNIQSSFPIVPLVYSLLNILNTSSLVILRHFVKLTKPANIIPSYKKRPTVRRASRE